MSWKRVIGWSVLLFVTTQLVAFCAGLSLAYWEIYGSTFEEAIANNRWARRIAVAVAAYLLYLAFLRGTRKARMAHTACVFAGHQLLGLCLGLIVTQSLANAIHLPSLATQFAVCALAYGTAWLRSNNSFKPKPLRGSA